MMGLSVMFQVCVERALASEDTGSLVQLLQQGAELDHLIVQRNKEGEYYLSNSPYRANQLNRSVDR